MANQQVQDIESFGISDFDVANFAADAVESSAIDSCFYEQHIPVAAVSSASGPSPEYVLNPHDRSILIDHHGRPVTVDKLLATKPLRHELLTRPGPGGRKLLYVSGESITRTLNDIFGFDGWQLEIRKVQKTVCNQEESKSQSNTSNNNSNNSTTTKPMQWHVAYIAHVRITHVKSGTFKEDLGAGDAIDRHLPTAIAHAMKASITDALKRAARHFGDKLGNSLYSGTFNLQNAPKTLAEALDQYDKERAIFKFGHPPQATTLTNNIKITEETSTSALNTITNRSIPQKSSEKTTTSQSSQLRSENPMKRPSEQQQDTRATGKHSIEVLNNNSNQPSKPQPPSIPQQHQHAMVSNMANHSATNTTKSQPLATTTASRPIQPPTHFSAASNSTVTTQSFGSVPFPPRVSLSDSSSVLPPATSAQGLNQLMLATTKGAPFLEWSSSSRPETSSGRFRITTEPPDPKKQKVNPYFAASSSL
jgi:recombination DNA repair RAD52 pathway protein